MNDGYVVEDGDLFFAAAMVMVYTSPNERESVVKKIELLDDKGFKKAITLAIPSIDAQAYRAEYDQGTLAISDLQNLSKRYDRLTWLCKNLQRSGEQVWTAERSPQEWASVREQLRAKQAASK